MLFALIDAATVQCVSAEVLLPAQKLLSESPNETQFLEALGEILETKEMEGFRFTPGSEADELMQTLQIPVP
jgi:hypothetical protein